MKKILLVVLLISAFSCKKETYHCYVCEDNAGVNPAKNICNVTQHEIDTYEKDNNQTCHLQ